MRRAPESSCRIIGVCLNWCSRLSRRPMVAIAPNALPKTSSRKGVHGRSCVRTCWKRRLRSSSTSHGRSGFASTLCATRSCPWHEDPSRRLGHASRGYPMSAMAVHEGASGRQPHRPGNRRADSPTDCDSGPPSPPARHVDFNPPHRRPAQRCAARRDHRELVEHRGSRRDWRGPFFERRLPG